MPPGPHNLPPFDTSPSTNRVSPDSETDSRTGPEPSVMKISLEWLRDYLPETPGAPSAAEALTFGGLPVEVIEQVNDDTVIDVEVTSNRGDCLSHVGIA